MTCRVAINGFGRIGRDFVRCLLDRGMLGKDLTVVAVNDLWDVPTLAHLLEFDSTYGRLRATVEVDPAGTAMTVDGHRIELLRQRDPALLPWAELGVDLVIESTGRFRTRDDAAMHLKAGAGKVLISSPGKNVDATIVLGVNTAVYEPLRHDVVSAASCT